MGSRLKGGSERAQNQVSTIFGSGDVRWTIRSRRIATAAATLGDTARVYDATGNVRTTGSFYANRFLFQGRDYSSDLGLYDYRNRIYYPAWGRFLQPDPIGFAGDRTNLYRYCGGDPVNRSDPSGLAGTVTADGNDINIDLPFIFISPAGVNIPGAVSQQYLSGISGYLTGAFGSSGQFTFNTNAHLGQRDLTYSSNLITVQQGAGASSTVIGTSTHTWHTELFPGVSTAYIFAHEALHILGLWDLYIRAASGLGYAPDSEGKPMPLPGIDPNNFMVGRGGTSLYDWQIQIIINNNQPTNAFGRFFREVVNAMKNDSGRLGPGNAGVYYNGTIYASGSQAAGVAAWDRTYGTFGFSFPSRKKF